MVLFAKMASVSCILEKHGKVLCNGTAYFIPEEPLNYKDEMFWVYLGIYVFLVLFAGLMSGLTMGLLSLDILSLRVLERGGKIEERKYAKKILPIVEKHHLLLVTLLLANAGAVEAMPIFMDRISNPIIAICVSVTAVLFFGEVVPQALCTRFGLKIGATMAPFVKLLMCLLFVIAWPISKLLDCLLGHEHSTFFRRAELKELVDLHKEYADGNEEPLRDDEVLIIQGALDMRNKTVRDRYTPLDNVFMLDYDDKLDDDVMKKIISSGHSRVPVFQGSRDKIIGLLLVKSLIRLNPEDATPVKDVYRSREGSLLSCSVTEPLFELLDKFQTGKSHMSLVYGKTFKESPEKRLLGIITLEDLIEQLIQEDIWDETDIPKVRQGVEGKVILARAKVQRLKSMDEGGGIRSPPRIQIQRAKSQESPYARDATSIVNVPSGSETLDDRQPLLK